MVNREQGKSYADAAPDAKPWPQGRGIAFLRLSKVVLSVHVGLAAAAGCLFHSMGDARTAVTVWAGVTLAAMAGSLVNNIQDQIQDQAFLRTQWRREAMASTGSWCLLKGAGLMLVLGVMLVLDTRGGLGAAAMVLGGLILYNGVYTPLKKRTYLALIPGSLCGMAALLAGWMASGGAPLDRAALSAALVVGVWQVPHAMVQNLTHAADIRKGVYPTITQFYSDPDLAFLTLMWVMLYNLSLYHLIFMASFSEWAMFLLFINAGLLTPIFAQTLFVKKKPGIAFGFLNASLLVYFIALLLP